MTLTYIMKAYLKYHKFFIYLAVMFNKVAKVLVRFKINQYVEIVPVKW